MDLLRRLELRGWYWLLLAFWAVVFVSLPMIVSIGFEANFFEVAWLCLIGWPEHDYFAAIFRPLRIFAPLPLVMLPFALRVRPSI